MATPFKFRIVQSSRYLNTDRIIIHAAAAIHQIRFGMHQQL